MLANTAPLLGVRQPSSLPAAPHQGNGGDYDHQLLPCPPPRSSIPSSHAIFQPGIEACLALPNLSLEAGSPAVDAASGSRVHPALGTGLDTAPEALAGLLMSVVDQPSSQVGCFPDASYGVHNVSLSMCCT